MLRITIGATEHFDDQTGKFVRFGGVPIEMEHSLASVSKWESLTGKSFLSDDKTDQEFFDYLKLMLLPGANGPDVLDLITQEDAHAMAEYIAEAQSATILPAEPERPGVAKKRITSEQIYSWMISLQIDWSAEDWHLNRLLTLIRLVNINNEQAQNQGKKGKPASRESIANRKAMNQARRAKSGSHG